jgi:predicted helicase
LEEPHSEVDTLFSNWLTTEAYEANKIKNETPVMCVIGNPPYAVSSTNKGEWIEKLLIDYKKDLKEKSYNSLSDDYVKFIRYGQHFIDKNGSGILAYISNNSFIDGVVFRQMRKSLLDSFDKLYILDLHGNSKKKEVSPDGTPDHNVFDIMQGVSINIFVKTGNKDNKAFGNVFQYDLYGSRDSKYKFLRDYNFKSLDWESIVFDHTNYFFVKKEFKNLTLYNTGFSTNELFIKGTSGIKTERDSLVIHFSSKELEDKIKDLKSTDSEEFRKINGISEDGRDWKLQLAKDDIVKNKPILLKIHYRPFDFRFTYYTGNTKGFHAYPRKEITNNFLSNNNLGLIHLRQNFVNEEYVTVVTNLMTEKGSLVCGNYFISPLYLYSEDEQQTIHQISTRTPNLNSEVIQQIAEKLGLTFTPEKDTSAGSASNNTFAPIDILDYIYAVLHSPTYREKYKEFLKIDFPRVPYPKDASTFWSLVEKGGAIRALHLLESPLLDTFITTYPESGTNQVGKVRYDNGKVYINETQYFDKVPQIAWEFFIGGYQPAQKWLKDRKDRALTFEDILHYQKIIIALTETDSLMKEIDGLGIEW